MKGSLGKQSGSFVWRRNSLSLDSPSSISKLGSRRNSIFDADRLPRAHYSQVHDGKYEIMVIDDDEFNQMLFEGLLDSAGFVVAKAYDGVEALKLLSSRNYLPDLILLDAQMPKMSGYEVCTEIRKRYPETVPIIMISANDDEHSIVQGLSVGCNDYVLKPFSRAQLLARIDTQIRSRDGWMAESQRTNDLIGQMYPDHVSQKLKDGEDITAESHECVTVLFSDIVGYTKMSTAANSGDVFAMLNALYADFDELCDRHGVYKVDTIGDAYMVVAGHNEASRQDHALRVFAMAKDMLAAAERMQAPDGSPIQIRVGLHSGPASFGLVGTKCPKYTLIGDTVNTASRMESNGFPKCIHASPATRDLIVAATGPACEWHLVGPRFIKGKGLMETYLAKVGPWENAAAAAAEAEAAASAPDPEPLHRGSSNSTGSCLPTRPPSFAQSAVRAEHKANNDVVAKSPRALVAGDGAVVAAVLRQVLRDLDEARREASSLARTLVSTPPPAACSPERHADHEQAVAEMRSWVRELQERARVSEGELEAARDELRRCRADAEVRLARLDRMLGDATREARLRADAGRVRREYIPAAAVLSAVEASAAPSSKPTPHAAAAVNAKTAPWRWSEEDVGAAPGPAAPRGPSLAADVARGAREWVVQGSYSSLQCCFSLGSSLGSSDSVPQSPTVTRSVPTATRSPSTTCPACLAAPYPAGHAPPPPMPSLPSSTPNPSTALASAARNDTCGAALGRAMETVARALLAPPPGGGKPAPPRWGGSGGRTEVDELLGFLGLEHYAAGLRREEVESVRALAGLGDAELEAAGVRSAGPRLMVRAAAAGLRVLLDRARERTPAHPAVR